MSGREEPAPDVLDLQADSESRVLPLLRGERFWNFTDFSAVNVALAIATWAFLIGGTTALFTGVRAGIAAIVIGNLIGVSLMGLAACLPTGKYGIDQTTAGRSIFGANGMRLVGVLVVLMIIGWTAVLGIMFGRATANVTNQLVPAVAIGPDSVTVSLLAILALVISWWLLRQGPAAIRKLNRLVAPGLVVVTAAMLFLIFIERSWSDLLSAPAIMPFDDERLNFMLAIEFNMAAGLGWWPIIGSLARYTKTQRAAYWPNLIGLFAAAVLGEIVGLFAALTLEDSDPTVWMIPLGGAILGIIALLFVAVANLSSIVSMVFSACLSLRRMLPSSRRISWSALSAGYLLVPAILVLFPAAIYDRFFSFLAWIALALAPLVGVALADYFLLRRQHLDLRGLYARGSRSAYHYLAGINPAAIVALLVGALVYRLLLDPIHLDHAGAFPVISASFPALVAGAAVHLLLTRVLVAPRGLGGYGAPGDARTRASSP